MFASKSWQKITQSWFSWKNLGKDIVLELTENNTVMNLMGGFGKDLYAELERE